MAKKAPGSFGPIKSRDWSSLAESLLMQEIPLLPRGGPTPALRLPDVGVAEEDWRLLELKVITRGVQ